MDNITDKGNNLKLLSVNEKRSPENDRKLTVAQINEFIMSAPRGYLATQVVMAALLSGCNNLLHLHNIERSNVVDIGSTIEINLPNKKCTILKKYAPVFKQYESLRPKNSPKTLYFHQAMSKDIPKGSIIFERMQKMPSYIAKFHKLPQAELYTIDSLPFPVDNGINQQDVARVRRSEENKRYGEELTSKLRILPLDVACRLKNQIQQLLDTCYKTHMKNKTTVNDDNQTQCSDFSNLFEKIKRSRSKDAVDENEAGPKKKLCVETVDVPSIVIVQNDASVEKSNVSVEASNDIVVYEEICDEDTLNKTNTINSTNENSLSVSSVDYKTMQIKDEVDITEEVDLTEDFDSLSNDVKSKVEIEEVDKPAIITIDDLDKAEIINKEITKEIDLFTDWKKAFPGAVVDNVLLIHYFKKMFDKYTPNDLVKKFYWLKMGLLTYENVNIDCKAGDLLMNCQELKGRLSGEQYLKFLNEASDDFLFYKVAIIIGFFGGLRKEDFTKITKNSVQDCGDCIKIHLHKFKNKIETFKVVDTDKIKALDMIRKYQQRHSRSKAKAFFTHNVFTKYDDLSLVITKYLNSSENYSFSKMDTCSLVILEEFGVHMESFLKDVLFYENYEVVVKEINVDVKDSEVVLEEVKEINSTESKVELKEEVKKIKDDIMDSELGINEEFKVETSDEDSNLTTASTDETDSDSNSSNSDFPLEEDEDKDNEMGELNLSRYQKIFLSTSNNSQNDHCGYPKMCVFCKTFIINFLRHLKTCHANEPEVVELLSYPPKTKKRRHLLSALRERGNNLINEEPEHVKCPSCSRKYFSEKSLRRHIVMCRAYIKSNSLRPVDELSEKVFPIMKPDKISEAAKEDPLICAFGIKCLENRKKYAPQITCRKMRELSKLLHNIKKLDPKQTNLFDLLQPVNFDNIVSATKIGAGYDEKLDYYKSPTYISNIESSLKKCCEIALTLTGKDDKLKYLTSPIDKAAENLKEMIHLIETKWRFEFLKQNEHDFDLNESIVKIEPLASDLKLLMNSLILKANEAAMKLKDKFNETAYSILLETIFCRVMLLNNINPAKLQIISLNAYQNYTCAQRPEDFENITLLEKILLGKIKKVLVRGGVPVLFNTDVQDHIKFIYKHRYCVTNNIHLFGDQNSKEPLNSYEVFDKYALTCGAKNPEALTSKKLRKHLVTLYQLFVLSEDDMQQLCEYISQKLAASKSSFQVSKEINDVAKLAKLLLLMETDSIEELKGKSFTEMDLSLDNDLMECVENDEEDEILDEREVLNCLGPTVVDSLILKRAPKKIEKKKKKPKVKRVHAKWSAEEKNLVVTSFKQYISERRVPKKVECIKFLEEHSDVFINKTWEKLRVFIQNQYRYEI